MKCGRNHLVNSTKSSRLLHNKGKRKKGTKGNQRNRGSSLSCISSISFISYRLPLATRGNTCKNRLRTSHQDIPDVSFPASPIPMPASLSNNIRRLRFERGMTQEELALRVGVSRQTVMSIERGATNPSVLLAYKISMALQTPVTEVFQMEGGLVPV